MEIKEVNTVVGEAARGIHNEGAGGGVLNGDGRNASDRWT